MQIHDNQPSINNDLPRSTPPADENQYNQFGCNPSGFFNTQPSIQPYTTIKPPRVYNGVDKIFAIIAFILGFAFIKVLINSFYGWGFMATVACIVLTLFNYMYCKKSGMNITKGMTKAYGVTFLLSALFVITDNSWVKRINFWLVVVSNLYLVYASYQSNNDSIIFNAFKAVIISPFKEYGSSFGALFAKSDNRAAESKSGEVKKNISPIALGLALSIPVTLFVASLLMSGDENFGFIYEKFIMQAVDWFFDNLFVNLMLFVFSIPLGMYIFSAVYSRVYKRKNESRLEKIPKINTRIFAASTCNAFLTPMSLLYVLYICTQISYFLQTINSISSDFDYSNYARSGFFQLCAVAVINLAVASCVIFLVKHDNKKLPASVRGFIVGFSILTICLIITAVVKMMMYIDIYGMTPLRIYTSIFMIYMLVLFVVLIIKQIHFNLSFTKIAYGLAVLVIIAMSLLPVDGLIARYNVEMYKSGKLEWMGTDAMYQLDSSAVSYFVECDPNPGGFPISYDEYNEGLDYNDPIKNYFFCQGEELGDVDIYNFNFSRYFAYLKAKDYGWVQ